MKVQRTAEADEPDAPASVTARRKPLRVKLSVNCPVTRLNWTRVSSVPDAGAGPGVPRVLTKDGKVRSGSVITGAPTLIQRKGAARWERPPRWREVSLLL